MKLSIEEAENGFIVEEDPEIVVNGTKMAGKKHVFASLEDTTKFITEFYTKRPNKNTRPKKKDEP